MMRWSLIGATLLAAGYIGGCVSLHDSHSGDHSHHGHSHADKPLPDSVQTAHTCRAGAFVEAASIVNSTVDIAMALPPNTGERTRAELDTILYTALKQAKSEVHCVSGALSFGYERSFAGVIKRGVALAQSRRLKQEVIEAGNSVVAALEANRRIAAPSAEAASSNAASIAAPK
jgi:hypothetical protein